MKLFFPFFFLSLLLSCYSCSDAPEKTPSKADAAALPHGESLPQAALSTEDRQKLANAKGKEVDFISADELAAAVQQEEGLLTIINFWKMDCPSCQDVNQILADIVAQKSPDRVRLLFVSLDPAEQNTAVKTYIREHNFTQQAFQLRQEADSPTFGGLLPNWNATLPAIWMYKKSGAINLLYHKAYGPNEFGAILEPLML